MSFPSHYGINFVPTIHNDIYPSINPTKSPLSQPSKTILITGAGRGIGRSIALRYAEAGVARLILCARTASELDAVGSAIRAIDPRVQVRKLPLDITDKRQVLEAVETVTREEGGKLHALINNAGTGDRWTPITEGVAEDYWRTWTVNVKGTYLMLKSFLPLLVATAKQENTIVDIVNMTSIGAHVTTPGASSYQTSKLALIRLSEFVQVEYGAQGVNCIAVHPGGVLTQFSKNGPPALIATLKDSPDLCGGFVVWLTHEARTWLAGRYVSANWDVDELESKREEITREDKLKVRMVV